MQFWQGQSSVFRSVVSCMLSVSKTERAPRADFLRQWQNRPLPLPTGTFVPVAQTLRHQPMRLLAQPSYTGAYDIDQDRLWTHTPQALPIDVLAVTRQWFRWPVLDGVYDITFRTERFVLFLNQHLSSAGPLLVLSNIRRCVGEPSPHFLYPFIQFGSGP